MMTNFERVLSYHPSFIADISFWQGKPTMSSEQEETKLIAQALVAMGDDELGPDEMWVKVIRKSWHHEWAQAGSVYKVKKEMKYNGRVYKLSGDNDLGLWATACEPYDPSLCYWRTKGATK